MFKSFRLLAILTALAVGAFVPSVDISAAVSGVSNKTFTLKAKQGGGYSAYNSGAGTATSIVDTAAATGTVSGGSGSSGGTSALHWSIASGNVTYGNVLTLTTDGTNPFGSGPQYHQYEDFANVTTGGAITSSNTMFSSAVGSPTAESDSNSGTGRSLRIWNSGSSSPRWSILTLPAHTTEMLVSYTVKIPTGTYFPNTNAVNTLPTTGSVWKFAWAFIEDGNDTGGNGPGGNSSALTCSDGTPTGQTCDNDYILINFGGQFMITDSNDLDSILYADSWNMNTAAHWVFGTNNRFAVWLKADPTNPATAASKGHSSLINSNGVFEDHFDPFPIASYNLSSRPIFAGGIGSAHYWTNINFPGWLGNFTCSNCDPRYGQIMVNSGTNARATVEFCNASTYAASTNCAYGDTTAWATGSITVKMTFGDLNPASAIYVYITTGADTTTRYSVGRIN